MLPHACYRGLGGGNHVGVVFYPIPGTGPRYCFHLLSRGLRDQRRLCFFSCQSHWGTGGHHDVAGPRHHRPQPRRPRGCRLRPRPGGGGAWLCHGLNAPDTLTVRLNSRGCLAQRLVPHTVNTVRACLRFSKVTVRISMAS